MANYSPDEIRKAVKILELTDTATISGVKDHFKKLITRWHPDKCEEHPEKYENPIAPVPDPDGWFHAAIIVDYPAVTVYVNDADQPSLEVEQISTRKEGWLGFWVGYGSDGWFKNLKITME